MNTNNELPDVYRNDDKIFEIHSNNKVNTLTTGDLAEKIIKFNEDLGQEHKTIVNCAPIYYPSNFAYGLISPLMNQVYTIIPGHYNFVDIAKLTSSQKSPVLIVEDNLLDIQVPKERKEALRKVLSEIKDVVVISNKENMKNKKLDNFQELFTDAKFKVYDEYSFDKI